MLFNTKISIFTILKQPVAISATASLILIKVTNDCFILYNQKINRSLTKTDDAIISFGVILSSQLHKVVKKRNQSLRSD